MPAPDEYVAWINDHVGFNPRGQGHSDVLTAAIIRDLEAFCGPFAEALSAGALTWRQNVGLDGKRHIAPVVTDSGELDTNIDGVVLQTEGLFASPRGIAVPITIENKTIMTAHGKARTNRFRDAGAYAEHVHAASPETVTAFTIVINTALKYRNPDAFAKGAAVSGTNKPDDAKKTVDLFRAMKMRSGPTERVGWCEAAFILAVEYDGETPTARLVTEPPAPERGAPFSYEWFLDRICSQFTSRNT